MKGQIRFFQTAAYRLSVGKDELRLLSFTIYILQFIHSLAFTLYISPFKRQPLAFTP